MTWFLRLFAAYRELEAQNASLGDKIDSLAAERAETMLQFTALTQKIDAARQSEIDTLRKVADHAARKHGHPIFDLASELPVRPEAYEAVPKVKMQGSDLVEQMEREFAQARELQAKRAVA